MYKNEDQKRAKRREKAFSQTYWHNQCLIWVKEKFKSTGSYILRKKLLREGVEAGWKRYEILKAIESLGALKQHFIWDTYWYLAGYGENNYPKMKKPPQHFYVYLVQIGDFPYYKIGIAKDYKTRIKGIQSNSPFEIKLVACVTRDNRSNALRSEAILHERYSDYSIRGEWFEFDAKVLENVKKNFQGKWTVKIG